MERRKNEVELLDRIYEHVFHATDFSWIVVHEVRLPPGWNRPATDVLIILEPGYPQTPPDNFYVPAGLVLADGKRAHATSAGGRNHEGQAWDQFSWHVDEAWWPTANIADGSNLASFMVEVERRLSEVN